MKHRAARPSAAGRHFGCFLLLIVALVVMRAWPTGFRLDRRAMYATGGAHAEWVAAARVLEWLPVAAAAVTLLSVVTLLFHHGDEPMMSLFILTGGNISAALGKWVIGSFLAPAAATMPSGHAMVGLTTAICLVFLRRHGRSGTAMTVGAGFVGTVAVLGVVVTYWHRPGDVVASVLLAGACLLGAETFVVGRRRRCPRPPSGRHRRRPDRTAPSRVGCEAAFGAGIAGVTVLGWGFVPKMDTWGDRLVGVGEVVLLPMMVVGVILVAARVEERLRASTH